MSDKRTWIIVDDQLKDAEAFAASLGRHSQGVEVTWEARQASEAQRYLLSDQATNLAGALIDVDLSSDGGVLGTGLGLAQDIRARQKNKQSKYPEFPVVRFANADPVREYVGDDPASDDLFDLLVSKEFARDNPTVVVAWTSATRKLYDRLIEDPPTDLASFAEFCGLKPEMFDLWSDQRVWQKVRLGLGDTSAIHVAAGAFMRAFLLPVGLLIDEETLAIRLGVDLGNSPDWPSLRAKLDAARYQGVGAEGFDRWWARGLDAFWLEVDSEEYLHQRTSEERVDRLRSKGLARITPLLPSARYWRRCSLSAQRGELRAVDPSAAVTLIQRTPQDPWVEPEQAAPDVAAMMKNDPRVDPEDLGRFTA